MIPDDDRRPRMRSRITAAAAAAVALTALCVCPAARADGPPASGTDMLNDAWAVWPSWSNKTSGSYHKIGVAYKNAIVQVLCWHDGGRVHDAGQGSSRWFLIFYQNEATPAIGF